MATVEADLARLNREIVADRPLDMAAGVEEIKDFVTTHVMQLRLMRRSSIRRAIAPHCLPCTSMTTKNGRCLSHPPSQQTRQPIDAVSHRDHLP